MSRIVEASEPLAMIMRLHGATWWEPVDYGCFKISVPKKGSNEYLDFKVLPQMIKDAEDVLETGTPAGRGALDPIPYDSVPPARTKKIGSPKRRR